ncbi:serpin family protein [Arthrobacter sp. H5]|uniref:serpin family protein n=1 Tax=Arthrobacter sp. H5 TaxID=1267973 RepID=UPI0004BCBAEE|nr:serpin family protein [Arthrobacter sp. H5]
MTTAPNVERVSIAIDDYPDAVDTLRGSAFRLGAEMLAGSPAENQVTSPVSALYALAMLRTGTGTTTAVEMDEVLGFPAENRDEAMNALLAQWQLHDGDPASVDEEEPPEQPLLHIANGVFVDEAKPTGKEYLETLASQYGTGAYLVDFGDEATGAIIDSWVSEHTGGRIEEAPLKPTANTTLSLLNTVYFAAAWQTGFEPANTRPGPFATGDGSSVQADMMRNQLTANYAEDDGWQAVDLPYNNGFVMRLVLPDEGQSPIIDEAQLGAVHETMGAGSELEAAVTLPKWEHEYTQDLKKLLTEMGLTETMGPAPDFRAIQEDVFVEGAAQTANITVAEKGTIAAAVTQINLAGSGPPPADVELVFDRPFLYQILHMDTGMPIFLGTVMDPQP